MITFKRFGNYGNLGNQLFQLASLTGFSKKYSAPVSLPQWQYSQYFKGPIPDNGIPELVNVNLQEPQFHFTPEWWDVHSKDYASRNINITGWLQSEKYFEHAEQEVRDMLTFKDDFYNELKKRYANLFTKPVIAISIRRGDYIDNPTYELLPIKYYLLALLEYFPDFRESYNIMLFSDDMDYCKLHFQCLDNAYYADGLDGISQLALGAMCDHFILANSTFSWWMAWLGEKIYVTDRKQVSTSKVIRPNFLFAGQYKKDNQEWSFWPERWTMLDHKIKRIDLTNVTFTIPLKFDSKDRMDNVNLSIKMLRHDFDTKIIVGEQGHTRFQYLSDTCRYVNFDDMKNFHRTKMLNDMAADCHTPIVVNWDADVVIPPLQIVESAHLISKGKADMVYPYDGRFARVNRNRLYSVVDNKVDIGMLKGMHFNGMGDHDARSVGGAIMFDSQAFIKGGMENEKFISYGPEDCERYDRFLKLGYNVKRVKGVLYHFDHVIGKDSGVTHVNYDNNKKELEKIRSLSQTDLRAYVDTWQWCIRYTPLYYESISESVIKSRDEVFRVLVDKSIIKQNQYIVDVGCALGYWGLNVPVEYNGIDNGVPEHKLVISPERYHDHDLRKPIPNLFWFKAHLVLCLEVAEHLEPEHADTLIDSLCSLGNTILFSAAIPCQGGLNHINEQWQSWWAKKFASRGFYPWVLDIRTLINDDVDIWYAQNMVLYIKQDSPVHKYKLDFVHPQMYMNLMTHYKLL